MEHEPRSRQDVIDFLTEQHRQIKELFDAVSVVSGEQPEEAFGRRRRMLAVHETADEEIVHPMTRKRLGDGAVIADALLREERAAKKILADLEKLDVGSAAFVEGFADLRSGVLTHAEHEEREEFPRLG